MAADCLPAPTHPDVHTPPSPIFCTDAQSSHDPAALLTHPLPLRRPGRGDRGGFEARGAVPHDRETGPGGPGRDAGGACGRGGHAAQVRGAGRS